MRMIINSYTFKLRIEKMCLTKTRRQKFPNFSYGIKIFNKVIQTLFDPLFHDT